MADARIHFVRHAETLFNVNGQLQGWCDSPLTERGEQQAAALGEWMRNVPVVAAFMSDLTRTRTTMAAALAGHPSIEAVPMRELREWNFGGWEGQPNADLWTPVFAAHGYTYVPGSADYAEMTATSLDTVIDAIHASDPLGRAESAADVNLRLTSGLATILAEAQRLGDSGDVVVVTHGTVLGSILRHVLPTHRAVAGFPNCGIVTVTLRDGVAEVSDIIRAEELSPR
jgi:probable phosphoglycerate mutase